MLEFDGFHAVVCRTLPAQMSELAGIHRRLEAGLPVSQSPFDATTATERQARPARASLRSQARTVGEVQVHDADASSEPGCSRDQKQPCPDHDGPGGSRDALTGRCETFDGDGCRHNSHRAKVHDPDDQEDRHETDTAVGAVEAEAQAVSPGRACVGPQRTVAPG
jgi:hypothetical protein